MSELVNIDEDEKIDKELILTKTNRLGFSKKISKDDFLKNISLKIMEIRDSNFKNVVGYCRDPIGKKDVKNFINQVLNNYWIQYQYDQSENKLENIYYHSVRLLPKKFRDFLKDEVALSDLQKKVSILYGDEIPDEIIIEELKEFNSISGKIKSYTQNFVVSDNDLLECMKKFDQNWIEDTFNQIDEKLKEEVSLRIMLLGKLGTGKSTLASVSEGYFSKINNTPPSERTISNNGRGTIDITTTEVNVGSIKIFFDDTIGQGDPGKGYSQEDLWKMIRNHLETSLKNGVKNLDVIKYTLDASIPRLDQTDFDTLEHLFIEFKRNYIDSLEWWWKVTILLTKANLIKSDKYSITNGIPKYESKAWAKKNGINYGEESKALYNEYYKDKLVDAMEDTFNELNNRIYQKIHRKDKTFDQGGESFYAYFTHLAKKYYPNLSDDEIANYADNFDVVVVGEAEKRDGVENNWDFQDCTIKPIPNFLDMIDENFDINIDYEIEKYTYTKNWFDDFMNKIYSKSRSDNFRLTVLRLNEKVKTSETNASTSTNSKVNLDRSREATQETFSRTTNQVSNNIIIRLINAIGSFFAGLFSGW